MDSFTHLSEQSSRLKARRRSGEEREEGDETRRDWRGGWMYLNARERRLVEALEVVLHLPLPQQLPPPRQSPAAAPRRRRRSLGAAGQEEKRRRHDRR